MINQKEESTCGYLCHFLFHATFLQYLQSRIHLPFMLAGSVINNYGSRSRNKFRIRQDPDPLHWSKIYFKTWPFFDFLPSNSNQNPSAAMMIVLAAWGGCGGCKCSTTAPHRWDQSLLFQPGWPPGGPVPVQQRQGEHTPGGGRRGRAHPLKGRG